MKPLACLIALLGLTVAPLAAMADPHKHERGHGRGHGPSYKEAFWVGPCKIERHFKKNGTYKEERQCHGPVAYGPAPSVVVMPAPVVVQPGVVIQATVRIP